MKKQNWLRKIEKFNKNMGILDVKFGSLTLGFLSAIGMLAISVVFVLIINYFFIQSKGYSKLILLIFYIISILNFNNSSRSLGKHFKIGYLSGAIIFILILIIGVIVKGPRLW